MNSENQSKKQKKSFMQKLSYLLGGNILTERFISKQSGLLLMIFFFILIFITNRYYCAKQLTEMDKLKKELIYLENERVNLNSRLTKISRQMQIEESLRKNEIELSRDNTNVYQIN